MTTLSHTVNSLSFGDPIDEKNFKSKRILKQVPAEHRQFAPMNAKVFNTDVPTFHHYIKVVSTHLQHMIVRSQLDDGVSVSNNRRLFFTEECAGGAVRITI
jgi:hypothetical protein